MNRKDYPVWTGVINYFPDALMEVSRVSKIGNDQHHKGKPLHWGMRNLIFNEETHINLSVWTRI